MYRDKNTASAANSIWHHSLSGYSVLYGTREEILTSRKCKIRTKYFIMIRRKLCSVKQNQNLSLKLHQFSQDLSGLLFYSFIMKFFLHHEWSVKKDPWRFSSSFWKNPEIIWIISGILLESKGSFINQWTLKEPSTGLILACLVQKCTLLLIIYVLNI